MRPVLFSSQIGWYVGPMNPLQSKQQPLILRVNERFIGILSSQIHVHFNLRGNIVLHLEG